MGNRISLVLMPLIASIVAAGCGGGGSIDDGTVALSATPAEISIKSAKCAASGAGPRVMVYGGVEPYTIYNPLPNQIKLSPAYVKDAGDSFEVFVVGGTCLDTIPLTITDSDANVITITVSHTDTSSSN